jgi:hypothetical protein
MSVLKNLTVHIPNICEKFVHHNIKTMSAIFVTFHSQE